MRVKATMEIRTKAVVFYEEGIRSAKEIGETYNLSERTVRRWAKAHNQDKETDYDQKRPGRNDHPELYPHHWNNELSGSKRNIPYGEPDGLSTNLTYPVLGEQFIVFSKNMDFSFVLKQNPSPPANDSNVVTLTACGREIRFSFVYGELGRSMSPVLLMTAPGIG